MAYSARTVANYLIEAKSKEGGTPPTPMQLLKLVYIAHGWNLAINDRPLINDRVEAWRYGPVIPKIYQDLKQWGNTPVTWQRSVRNAALDLRWQVRSQSLYRQEVNFLGILVGQEPNDDGELSFRLYGPWQRLRTGA